MTVPDQTPRIVYTGNGVTTIFAMPSVFEKAADLLVVGYTAGVPTTYVLNTDYTVSGGDAGAGPATGSVTFLVAPPLGTSIYMIVSPAFAQAASLIESGSQPALTTTNVWDLLTLISQRLRDAMLFCVKFPDDYVNFNPTIPEGLAAGGAALAGKALIVNPAGNGWIWSTPTSVAADVPDSTFSMQNNQPVASVVTGMAVDAVSYRGVIFEYDVQRSGDPATEVRAIGRIICLWNSQTAAWTLFYSYDGDGANCGVVFTAQTTGTALQVLYTTTNIANSGNSVGKLNWKVRTFNV